MRNSSTYIFLLLLIWTLSVKAQDTTSRFIIEGEVAKPVVIDYAVLKTYKTISLDSMPVYNHAMKYKGVLKNIKGVLLKDLFDRVTISETLPKKWSEFYIVCTSIDGYKVVFSWNELFNGPAGEKAMIVIEKNGSALLNQEDRIVLISPADVATGRRYVKGLDKIIVQRVK